MVTTVGIPYKQQRLGVVHTVVGQMLGSTCCDGFTKRKFSRLVEMFSEWHPEKKIKQRGIPPPPKTDGRNLIFITPFEKENNLPSTFMTLCSKC